VAGISYDWLENLVGLEIHTRDRIVEELRLKVGIPCNGDRSSSHRGLARQATEPGRALVLDGWAFVVEPLDGHRRSRFLARTRIPGKAAVGWGLLLEFPHFIMERRMLKGIKERAERARAGHEAR
jgi:hypothetical protein